MPHLIRPAIAQQHPGLGCLYLLLQSRSFEPLDLWFREQIQAVNFNAAATFTFDALRNGMLDQLMRPLMDLTQLIEFGGNNEQDAVRLRNDVCRRYGAAWLVLGNSSTQLLTHLVVYYLDERFVFSVDPQQPLNHGICKQSIGSFINRVNAAETTYHFYCVN